MSPVCVAASNIDLLEDESVAPGDWVLIPCRLRYGQDRRVRGLSERSRACQLMGQAYTDEVRAVLESRIA